MGSALCGDGGRLWRPARRRQQHGEACLSTQATAGSQATSAAHMQTDAAERIIPSGDAVAHTEKGARADGAGARTDASSGVADTASGRGQESATLLQPIGAAAVAALNGASHLGSLTGKHGQHRRRPLTAKSTTADPVTASSPAQTKGASTAWLRVSFTVTLRPTLRCKPCKSATGRQLIQQAHLCRCCCRGRVQCGAKDILRQGKADAAWVDPQSQHQLCGRREGVWQGRGSVRCRAHHGAAHAVAMVRFCDEERVPWAWQRGEVCVKPLGPTRSWLLACM